MRLRYRPETDSLSVVPADPPGADESVPAVVLEFDDAGRLVNLDLQHAAAWSISRGPGRRSVKISLVPPEPALDDGGWEAYAG